VFIIAPFPNDHLVLINFLETWDEHMLLQAIHLHKPILKFINIAAT
jgi:hypothetical protein